MNNRVKDWGDRVYNQPSNEIESMKRQVEHLSYATLKEIDTLNTWHDGVGIPASDYGKDGDYYLQLPLGDIYKKELGNWERIGNIRGEQGIPGEPGPPGKDGLNGENGTNGTDGVNGRDGSLWYDGSGFPPLGLGQYGDYYLDLLEGDIYKKYTEHWERIGSLRGPRGTRGPEGPEGVQGPRGETGPPFMIKKMYPSVGAMEADKGNIVPGWFVMISGDSLEPEAGSVYVKTQEGTLVFIVDMKGQPGIAGPQGPEGAQGPRGYQGEQGEVGPEGPIGPPGPQGDIGPMGTFDETTPFPDLSTTNKTIVGAVNETNVSIANLQGPKQFIYRSGNEYKSITGGWTRCANGATTTKGPILNEDNFQLETIDYSYASATTVETIDLTKYSAIVFGGNKLQGDLTALAAVLNVKDIAGPNRVKVAYTPVSNSAFTIRMDVSELSGRYYIATGIGSTSSSPINVCQFTSVWLVPDNANMYDMQTIPDSTGILYNEHGLNTVNDALNFIMQQLYVLKG